MTELTYFKACLLGLVQGLTEFLPVSSSGHLVITQNLLGLPSDAPETLLFDVVTHFGTLLAVLVVFAGTFARFARRLVVEVGAEYAGRRTAWRVGGLAVAACIPTAVIGFAFKDSFERAFSSLATTAAGLLFTGTFLYLIGLQSRPSRGWRRFGWWRAALVGIAQGCAIMPGVSRSGSTICTAMLFGLKRRWAAEFSFLIATPTIGGVVLMQLRETLSLPESELHAIPWGPIAAGSAVGFVSGAIALHVLLDMVIRDKIHYFSYYCWIVGAAAMGWWAIGSAAG